MNKVGKGVMGLSGTVLFWLKASKKVYWNLATDQVSTGQNQIFEVDLQIPTIVQHK